MRLIADECLPIELVAALRGAGHDVHAIIETEPSAADLRVAALARDLDRVVVTTDYDFGELAVRRGVSIPGVILIAPHESWADELRHRLIEELERRPDIVLGHLTILGRRNTRRRAID